MFDPKFVYSVFVGLLVYLGLRVLIFIRDRRFKHSLFRKHGIPGPEPHLIHGELHKYISDPTYLLKVSDLTDKYGDTVGLYAGGYGNILSKDVEFNRKVFMADNPVFTERSHVYLNIPVFHSVLFGTPDRWRTMRKLMAPHFSSYTMRGAESTQFIENSLSLMIRYIDHKLKQSENGKKTSIDIQDLMRSTSLHMISALAIKLPGIQVGEGDINVKILDTYMASLDTGAIIWAIRLPFLCGLLEFLSRHLEHNKLLSKIKRHLDRMIDAFPSREKSNAAKESNEKLIDILIRLHHEGKMSRTEVIGNAEAILMAGYDTTSTTLSYFFWALAKHPDIQTKLRDDLIVNGLESKYLEQVMNETMRRYPTILSFISRLSNQAVEINGIPVPKNVRVIYNTWLFHSSPEFWPDPLKFDPERFREGVSIDPIIFAPFGLGKRKCLGMKLAQLELKMIACDLLLRYRFHLVSPQELELRQYASSLTKPIEKIMLDVESL